ncbi:FecR domain-containing protein [Pyxidicoccus sp. MSG2]|uniref:FecR domain-containing protein n=1 Tax=Pyxidicoccus sp. MSG2 TaxID=2996790 RepID=UPI002270D601|nr:FecR domain-containing protein [Pyxidicoccus sp. MSG2]MCY1015968.1 FecR domain-containing protein [Pyxidicoccus sp. MSG2]
MAGHEVQALWALAAGELDAAERSRVEAHVSGCAECAAELERVKQSRAALHTVREVTPDVRWDVVDAGLRAAAARQAAARSLGPWARLREAAAQRVKPASGSWRPGAMAAPRSRLPWAMLLAGACAAMLGFWMLRTPDVAPGTTVAVLDGDGAPDTPQTVQAGTPQTETVRDGDGALAELPREGTGTLDTAQAESTSGAVVREAGGAERTLQAGTKLRSGVAVRTPARATAMLRLPDASRVRLSAGSEVELSRAEARDVHLTVRRGRLSVQASHAQREGFLVEAAGLRVSVVGTVFTVEHTEHGAAVAVAEGRVRVEVEGQPPRLVSAGERVELDSRKQTLKHAPVSEPDQRAFAELSAPEAGVQAPATGKPVVAMKEPRPQAPRPENKESAELPEEIPTRTQVVAEVAPSKDVASSEADPDQEFAPYPAKSVTEQLPPKMAEPPAPPPPTAVAERPAQEKKKEPLIPMALLSGDADERFLGYARLQMRPRKCESFLVGLQEIAQRSPRADHRDQARQLRARCLAEKPPQQAPRMDPPTAPRLPTGPLKPGGRTGRLP